jgi:DNA-binding MarR family transcriptional regulator
MTPTRPLSDRDYQSLADFRYALRTFLRFSEDAARSAGLTPNQHQLLLPVRGWHGEVPPSIGDVAERLQLRHHSTVELVQRAEAAAVLETEVDPTDHRRQLLRLTPSGEEKLATLSIQHRQELKRFRVQMADLLALLE